MGILNDLLRKLGFTSGDDEQDSELDDDEMNEDEEYEESEDEDDYESGGFRNPFSRERRTGGSGGQQSAQQADFRSSRRDEEKVIHDPRMDARGAQQAAQVVHCERVVKVLQIEECRDIIEYIVNGESVLLNLENIDPKDSGRVVDLLSGAAFALRGRMVKVAHLCYLLAPESVQVVEADAYAPGRARYR